MAETIGLKALDGPADRRPAGHLSRVRSRADAAVPRDPEGGFERLRRVLRFAPAEADRDDAAVAILDRVARGFDRGLEAEATRNVGRQPHLDTVLLRRFDRSVAEAGEDLVPGSAAAHAFCGSEDAIDVDGAVRGSFLRVRHDDLTKIDF